MSAYREQAERPEYEEEKPAVLCGRDAVTIVGDGRITRKTSCRTPGALDRFFYGVKEGDVWTCDSCGKGWTWGFQYASPVGWRWMPR